MKASTPRRRNIPSKRRLATTPLVSVIISFLTIEATIGILPTVDAFIMPPNSMTGRSQAQPHATSISSASSTGSVNSGMMMVDESMVEIYDTLATRLIDRYEKDAASNSLQNNQLFVCVAGGPGSGKSTLSTAVAQRINEQMMPPTNNNNSDDNSDDDNNNESSSCAVVLPMDGFHYSRSQLQSMGNSSDSSIDYTYDELLARRGAPWTFDAEECVAAFTAARLNGYASLPVYCRRKSDPVPDGVQLHPKTKIVFLEGNYLLAWDDARWAPLRTNNVFDEMWYIGCKSLDEQRERLVKRHLETWSEEKTKMWGEGEIGAGAKADANDMLNVGWIEDMSSRKYADLVIES